MKVKSSELIEALNRLKPIVGRRNTLPILSTVKISAAGTQLELSATDLDQWQVEHVACEGGLTACCVRLDHLLGAVGGESSDLSLTKEILTVACSFGSTEISILSADEFPPKHKHEKAKKLGASCADLTRAMGLVSFAASTDPSRYNIQSVFVSSAAKRLHAVSTNGRELAMVEINLIGSDFEITVPSGFVDGMARALLRKDAQFLADENHAGVIHADGSYWCKQIDGKYPNFRQVIPAKKEKIGTVNASEFRELLTRCLCFREQDEPKGIFRFSKTGLLIEFRGAKNGTAFSYSMPGKFTSVEIALNIQKMLMVVSQIEEEECGLFWAGDNLSPITIEAGDLSVLSMPMQMV